MCCQTGRAPRKLAPVGRSPDDLIWAYSRQLKQIGANARTQANRLYVTESDLRHYSTPWRAFPNGELFYDVGTPDLVQAMKKRPGWDQSDIVVLGHSDRWDTGPQMSMLHGWQDFVEFDEYLREKGLAGIDAKNAHSRSGGDSLALRRRMERLATGSVHAFGA